MIRGQESVETDNYPSAQRAGDSAARRTSVAGARRAPPPAGRFASARGMSFIELCIVIGMVSILFAMVLGLAKHVNAITRIRRAQAELGEWHEALNRWFNQFGEYPCFDMSGSDERSSDNLVCSMNASRFTHNLTNVIERACVRIDVGGNYELIHFRSYITGSPNPVDPWGMPYILICEDDDPDDSNVNPRTTYRLFSCGPDAKTKIIGNDEKTERDDVYFEP